MSSDSELVIDRILEELQEMVDSKHDKTLRILSKKIEADLIEVEKKLQFKIEKIENQDNNSEKED